MLYFYSVLDMISRPLSEKRFLDRVSQIGLIRGKWYTSESVAEFGQENVLKASAIPVYDLSAMTAKRVSSYWVSKATRSSRCCRGTFKQFLSNRKSAN